MWKKNQSNTILDQSRPGSTLAMHPIDSIQDARDKWVTRAANTIKLPTQSTTIRTWNFYALYAFRERVDELPRIPAKRTKSCRRLSVSSPPPHITHQQLKKLRDLMILIHLPTRKIIWKLNENHFIDTKCRAGNQISHPLPYISDYCLNVWTIFHLK